MKSKTTKEKPQSQKNLPYYSSDSSDDEALEDYEEDQNIGPIEEEEKISVNGESDSEVKKPPKTKSKPVASKNPTKKLRNQKKPRIVMNVSDTKYDVVRHVGKKIFKWKLSMDPNEEWDLFWTDNSVEPEQLSKMQLFQKINHFPGMYSLARKNHLGRNLMRMRKNFPDHYKFFPPTWLLPAEYSDFKAQFNKKLSKTFIIKPEASCQGRGIFLTRNYEDVDSSDHYVAQRYIHKPYLIDGLKFDCRIYVLLAGTDPLRIYLYNDGLGRFATEPYINPTKDNLDDVCMHLTNYAINKDNPNFIFNENAEKDDVGHKRSFISVLSSLKEKGADVEKLMTEIKEMIIKTFCSVQPVLSHNYKSCQPDSFYNNMCFEVLGIDILIDHKLKPWLLEVNHTPSFTTDTPFDRKIKKNVIRDSLILMNISVENRIKYKNLKKIELQKRVLTGKKVKLTQEEKTKLIEIAQQERDEYEAKNLGGFTKVYPLNIPEEKLYDDFIKYSTKLWEEWTGANIRRNTKKITEEKKEKGTPNSLVLSKKASLEKPPLQKAKTLHKQGSQNITPILKTESTTSHAQSLQTIPQKILETTNENISENTKNQKENNIEAAVITENEGKKVAPASINENNDKASQSAKINGFRIKTKVFNARQSPIPNSDEKTDEVVKIAALETNTIISNGTTDTQSKPLEPSSSNTSSNQNIEFASKKISFMTKNGQTFKNFENRALPESKTSNKLLEKSKKSYQSSNIQNINSGNYLTPKVMEFALNGFLRPEEDRYEAMKGKALANSKQKGFRMPADFGIFGTNANMFNVQKHINYFQNPKH